MKRFHFLLSFLTLMLITIASAAAQSGSWLDDLEPISVENASGIEQVAELKCECRNLTDIVWSPDGSILAVASSGDVWLYSPFAPNLAPILLEGSTHWIEDMAFSPDGTLLAVANNTQDSSLENQVVVWNVAQHTKQAILPFGQIDAVSFKTNNDLLSSDGSYLQVWNIENSTTTARFSLEGIDNRVLNSAFSHDNTLLAVGINQGATLVWNAETGKQVAGWHDGYTQDLTFSHNDQLLAGTYLGYTGLWNPKDAVHNHDFIPHLRAVYDLAFNPDDSLLAEVEYEGSTGFWLRLYKVDQCDAQIEYFGTTCQTLVTFAQDVFDPTIYEIRIAFNPAGTLLTTVSQDGFVRFWGIRQ